MAALARLQAGGSVSRSPTEDANLQKLARQYERREARNSDEVTLLPVEDMHIFGSTPMTDPLDLVSCNRCRKPIKASQYRAHAELCKSLHVRPGTITELDCPSVTKKPQRKGLLIIRTKPATPVSKSKSFNLTDSADINPPESTVNRKASESTVKGKPSKSTVKRKPSESTVKRKSAESIVKRKPSESTVKEKTSKATVKKKPSESTVKGKKIRRRTALAETERNDYHNGISTATTNGSESGPYDLERVGNVTSHPSKPVGSVTSHSSKPLTRVKTESLPNLDSKSSSVTNAEVPLCIPAPIATKMYYSQRNHDLRRAIRDMFYNEPCKVSYHDASNSEVVQANVVLVTTQTSSNCSFDQEHALNQQEGDHLNQTAEQIPESSSDFGLWRSGDICHP